MKFFYINVLQISRTIPPPATFLIVDSESSDQLIRIRNPDTERQSAQNVNPDSKSGYRKAKCTWGKKEEIPCFLLSEDLKCSRGEILYIKIYCLKLQISPFPFLMSFYGVRFDSTSFDLSLTLGHTVYEVPFSFYSSPHGWMLVVRRNLPLTHWPSPEIHIVGQRKEFGLDLSAEVGKMTTFYLQPLPLPLDSTDRRPSLPFNAYYLLPLERSR